MDDRITAEVEHHGDATVVRLYGALTLATAPVVRTTMLKCLAGCPTALIVDLDAVTVDSDLPLTVFSAVQRQAARWPGVPMMLCRPTQALSDRLARPAILRHMPVYAELADALGVLGGPMRARPTIRSDLPATTSASRVARDLVMDACRDWRLDHLMDDAEMIVSELASNAIRHARPPVRLTIAIRGDYVHLAVSDGSRRAPRLVDLATVQSGPAVEHGRGLHLITALASAWGSMLAADGKVVWATLRAQPIGPAPA